MSKTRYDPERAKFSEKAHMAARSFIYPIMFKGATITYHSPDKLKTEEDKILDLMMGIDKYIEVKIDKLKSSIPFTIQERFRAPEFAHKRDLTITEWNHNSNQKSELYKLYAHIFVYGYYDSTENKFLEIIAVDIPHLMYKIVTKKIKYTRVACTPKNQSFIHIPFDRLMKKNMVLFHKSFDF